MAKAKQNLVDLFLELAQPDSKTGVSDWVYTSQFVGKYKALELGNGWSWGRRSSRLRKEYDVEVQRAGQGNAITAIRLKGYNPDKDQHFNQNIRKDITDAIRQRKCVMLGVNGKSENTKIEVDHKDGRKDDMRVSDLSQQRIEDFQPLCKAANDIKRQICKNCKRSDKRWDARNIEGNPYPFYEGDEEYNSQLGCVGCYQYDPVEYRRRSALRISQETTDYILNKIYPGYKPQIESKKKK